MNIEWAGQEVDSHTNVDNWVLSGQHTSMQRTLSCLIFVLAVKDVWILNLCEEAV